MTLQLPLNLLSLLITIAGVWLAVAGVFDCVKSARSDSAKIAWITFMICLPFAGPLFFFLFAGSGRSKQSLAESEAALKQRFNQQSQRTTPDPADRTA